MVVQKTQKTYFLSGILSQIANARFSNTVLELRDYKLGVLEKCSHGETVAL